MPEAEAPGHVGRVNEIEPQEFIDRVHRRSLGRGGRGRRQLGLERVARHRRAFEHQARVLGQQRELFGQRGGDGGRDADAGQRDLGRPSDRSGALERPGELLQVEGVAAALLVKDGCARRRRTASPRNSSSLNEASERRARSGSAPPRGAPARARPRAAPAVWRGRSATAMSTAAAGGRRSSAPSSSTDAESAQWRSSSTSTSGAGAASRLRSSRTARWLR